MKVLGCDVSAGRTSESAFVWLNFDPVKGETLIERSLVETLPDLPSVVDYIEMLELKENFDGISVDAVAFGRGAVDYLQLKPFRHKLHRFVANERASREWEDEATKNLVDKTYSNFKTRVAYEMRKDGYRGKVKINPTLEHLARLTEELQSYALKKVNGRWKLEDPKKSPDLGDAVLAAYCLAAEFQPTFWLGA